MLIKRIFNYTLVYLFLLFVSFSSLQADTSIYGRLDLAISNIETIDKGSSAEIKSLASRVGFKGSQIFDNGLAVIYQYELEVDAIDWDPAFKQRNSFIGLKGAFGKFIIGMHDTPVKNAARNIDLFNDTSADIKKILWGENRSKKIVQWSSPKVRGFTFNLMGIFEKDEALSLSLDWNGKFDGNKARFSLAYDSEVPQKGYFFDTTRISAAIPLGKLLTFGVIWQESEDTSGKFDDDGYILSLKAKMSEKAAMKLMYGESDMIKSGSEVMALGFDYKIIKPFKIYINYIEKDFANSLKVSEELMFGFQYKFNFGLF